MNELNALQNSLRTAIMKNPYSGIRVIAQVVEHLPSNHEGL
jgi:hypothetical protein